MAFENAIITKEDDEKYGLSEIYHKYNPMYERLPKCKPWIIDRNLDCWIMETGYFPDPNCDHAMLPETLWKLYYKGDIFDIILYYVRNQKVNKVVYDRVWKVISICPEQSHNLPKSKIIPLLRNIFIAFGFDGLRKQVKNFKITVIDSRKGK